MDVFVLDKTFKPLGVIDYCQSIIVSTYYNQIGDFELYVPVTEEALEILKVNNIVYLENDRSNLLFIQNVKIQTDIENADYITVTGFSAEIFIKNRIAWGLNETSGSLADCIRKLLTDNLIDPEDSARKNPLVKIGGLVEGETLTKQTTGGNLLEVIEQMLEAQKLGHRMNFDGYSFVFSTYEGTDRTYNQTSKSPVLFSPDFDNLLATEYEQNFEGFANVALVAGEGEGIERKMAAVGTASGIERVETYVDARNLSSKAEEGEEELTPEEYETVLKEKGKEALAELKETESFEAEIEPAVVYKYKKDYFVGDLVTVINEYGMQLNARIVNAVESWDENGYKLIIKFEKKGDN